MRVVMPVALVDQTGDLLRIGDHGIAYHQPIAQPFAAIGRSDAFGLEPGRRCRGTKSRQVHHCGQFVPGRAEIDLPEATGEVDQGPQ